MPAQNDPPKGPKIEIFKLVNNLRRRIGADQRQEEGFLAPEAIEEADRLITELGAEGHATLGTHLENLAALWEKTKNAKTSDERDALSREMFTLAHEIKDVSAMFQYTLLSHFAESLRDYIGQTELNLQAQIVIIQAHIDAMQIVHKQNVLDDAGPQAEELKRMVKKAVDKYK